MFRHECSNLSFVLIALGLAVSTPPMPGQAMSFFRQFTPVMDRPAAVVDASGIYVIGNGGALRKYDSRGNELWTRGDVKGYGFGGAADLTGVYVLGLGQGSSVPQLLLRKYSASGNELWTRPAVRGITAVAADSGGVYIAVRDGYRHSLRKYSSDGSELWTRQWDAPSQGVILFAATDTTGVYVLSFGVVGSGAGLLARKWDPRGNELWHREYPTGLPTAVTAADPGGFYAASGTGFGLGSPSLRRYDAGGNELWTRPLATAFPKGLAADATGVYVVGTTSLEGPLPGQCRSGAGADSFVRKYDLDGAELWTRQFGTPEATSASGVAVNASGVYVVGQEGSALVRAWPDALAPNHPALSAFLAKFEKTAAVVTGSGPRIFPDCVVNAASYVGGGVAPGELVTIFGSAMGPSELVPLRVTEDHRLATTLADTRILFNGVPAPLLYVSDKQSSAIVPHGVADRPTADIQVEHRGVRSDPVTMPVLASRPGIFSLDASGYGQGAILNEDGSLNSPSNPAPRGSIITIFGTGGGEAAPGVGDGQIVSDILPRTSLPVSVFFDVGLDDGDGGVNPPKPGEVLYAGGSPGSVAGLLQVNVRVPANAWLTGDAVPLALVIGSQWTVFQVTIALR